MEKEKELKRLEVLKDYMSLCKLYYKTYSARTLSIMNDIKFILFDEYNMELDELSNIEFYCMLQVRDLKNF